MENSHRNCLEIGDVSKYCARRRGGQKRGSGYSDCILL